jgi:thiosulfate dehydrogenase [quinone] large subunit
MRDFFTSKKASWIWLVLRLYVGYEFVTAGWEKITGPKAFDAAGFLNNAIKMSTGAHPSVQPWFASFLKGFALPNVGLFNLLVKYGELLVGLALILGFATLFAASMGMLMNFAFMFAGSTSTNPQLVVLAGVIIFAGGAYAGHLGVDYYLRPLYRNFMDTRFAQKKLSQTTV